MNFKVELVTVTPNALDVIEKFGRLCYDSPTNKETQDRFIADKIKKDHTSLLEHAAASFLITGVSRCLTHQAVRHRVGFSPTQESQRYVKAENFDYVTPPTILNNAELLSEYITLMSTIAAFYSKMLKANIPAEDARFVLPGATVTKIAVTMNFRALRHFIELRADKHAQWEIRGVAKEMLMILYKLYPCCFEDLVEKFEV
ncbi:MAG: Thymidylate synthase ThyX [Firmicutes bacterium ADurb.Bin419]|jgi:thymidylate synthase (FAD)|nr:MAG: Thymidylate synthase ThyX [Firmicutes bacterium ADurb.Bin419]